MIFSNNLKTKLIFFALSVSFLALSLSLSYNFWSSFESARTQRLLHLRSLSELMAFNLEAPLAFSDEEAAQTTLQSLRYESSIAFAHLTSADGRLEVDYIRTEGGSDKIVDPFVHIRHLSEQHEEISLNHIAILRPIVFQGNKIGELFFFSPLTDIWQQMFQSLLRAVLVLIICLGIAFFVASALQKRITKPLSDLLSAMRDIEQDKDYSKRIETRGKDEFSMLITRFNEMLRQIEKRDSGLEEMVSRRTEELRETLSLAETANKAKSEFLANMSHELRTPLNGIVGMISMLEDFEMPDEQNEVIELLSTSADTLLSVINDVLDFSKIEQGKIEIENEEFQFEELMESVRGLIEFQAENKGISYIDNLQVPSDYQFTGDYLRLRQVLLNLTSNALKFTGAGGAIIMTSWLEEITDSAGRLYFAVADTGIGIPESKLGSIFQSFTQADGSTTRRYGGTGLGLTISKQLVQLMSGQIQVKSIENVGSRFSFYASVNFKNQHRSKPKLVHKNSNKNFSHGLRILVAEDNRINQTLAQKLLESEEHTVVIAHNGKEATELLEAEEFDIVLMDVQMPVMDGLEATKFIRQMSGDKRNIPIIGVSAHAFQEFKDRSVSTGMSGYITKPYRKKELLEGIDAALKTRSNQQ